MTDIGRERMKEEEKFGIIDSFILKDEAPRKPPLCNGARNKNHCHLKLVVIYFLGRCRNQQLRPVRCLNKTQGVEISA